MSSQREVDIGEHVELERDLKYGVIELDNYRHNNAAVAELEMEGLYVEDLFLDKVIVRTEQYRNAQDLLERRGYDRRGLGNDMKNGEVISLLEVEAERDPTERLDDEKPVTAD